MSVIKTLMSVTLAGLLCLSPASAAAELPAGVAAEMPGLQLVGQARLRKYLFHVYDASLWAPRGRWDPAGPFVLDIRYARNIPASQINERTLLEWRRMGFLDGPQGERLRAALDGAWPDVAPGDHLSALSVPGRPVRIFHNGRPYSARDLPGFAEAFFAIWLDPRTSEPAMRSALLGDP